MITNPNTCGLFEPDMIAISDAVHAAGALVYCDGANFNAIVGKVRPGDLGIDAMHINLHKTFSTPHGGGGPGSGPVVLSRRWRRSRRCPSSRSRTAASSWSRRRRPASITAQRSFGRMVAFHGQMGMFTRALTYILSHGADGLKQVAEDAVLNANYILRSLEDVLDAPFAKSGPCMHEAIFQRQRLRRRAQHARPRQGADRRGLPPDDHVFPAGRPRRDAGRADRDRVQGEPRPVHRRDALDRRAGQGRRREPQGGAGPRARGGGSTRRWRRASRFLYGPYRRAGVPTAPSNESFDASLRARDPQWGLRQLEAVVAAAYGFRLERVVEMPANNLTIVFRRS
jgi:hypothetical protein